MPTNRSKRASRSRQTSRSHARRRAPSAPPRPSRRGSLRLALVLAGLVGVNLYVFLWRGGTSIPDVMQRAAVTGRAPAEAEAQAQAQARTAPAAAEAAPAQADESADDSGRVIKGKVEKGDSLGKIFHREGLTAAQANELIRALEPKMDFRSIRAGQHYRLELDDAGQVKSFEFQLSRIVRIRAERGPDGKLTAKRIQAATETRVEKVGGTIKNSLYAAIKASGEDTSLVSFFVDVFAYDINFFTDTRPGDTFRLLVQAEYLNGKFYRYDRVLAAEYKGKVGTFRVFWWKQPGAKEGGYYRQDGHSAKKTFLKTPVKYTRISSKFSWHRYHPILHYVRAHLGVDFAAPIGSPVWAAASGRIIRRGWCHGGGNCIEIKHHRGLVTIYMHLSKFRKGQHVGEWVRQKQVIGYVGMTGLATGPHLHFGVKKNGHYVNPLKLKMTPGPPVPKRYMAKFRAATQPLVARLARVPLERTKMSASALPFALPKWLPGATLFR